MGNLTAAVQGAVPLVLIYIFAAVPAAIIQKSGMSENLAKYLLPATAKTAGPALALLAAFGTAFLITFIVGSTTAIATTLIGAFAPTLLAFGQSTLIYVALEKDKFGSYVYLYSATKDGKFRPDREIICYEGPPGTGKTTFVQNLSRAMGRGEPQIVPCAGLKEFKNYSILGSEDKPSSDEQVQRDLIKLFQMYKNKNNDQSEKLFDKYYQMDIELDHLTFFSTVNYPEQLVPALKNEVEMRKLEDYSEEDKIAILKLKKKEIEAEIKKIYGEEKEIIPAEIIQQLPKYIKEKGIRQAERVLYKIKKEYINARENGREFSLGNPQEWLKKNVLAYQESFQPDWKHYGLFFLGGII
ncbi:29281_t:CDS:2 [Gigaspora margarita]|uniref:29281_t:CDS:1 n=1 Tax=Gigaspora margarita TaxID=4874 RepID=A0ABM8W129_GIGMA|nr:29281_t:CDS:2 [Gigaspora margarita]